MERFRKPEFYLLLASIGSVFLGEAVLLASILVIPRELKDLYFDFYYYFKEVTTCLGWIGIFVSFLLLSGCAREYWKRIPVAVLFRATLTAGIFSGLASVILLSGEFLLTSGKIPGFELSEAPRGLITVALFVFREGSSVILQEILMRGVFLFFLMKGGIPSPLANFFQAILFALAHPRAQRQFFWFLFYSLFGWIMGWSVLRYKSLYPAIMVHTLGNFLSYALGYEI